MVRKYTDEERIKLHNQYSAITFSNKIKKKDFNKIDVYKDFLDNKELQDLIKDYNKYIDTINNNIDKCKQYQTLKYQLLTKNILIKQQLKQVRNKIYKFALKLKKEKRKKDKSSNILNKTKILLLFITLNLFSTFNSNAIDTFYIQQQPRDLFTCNNLKNDKLAEIIEKSVNNKTNKLELDEYAINELAQYLIAVRQCFINLRSIYNTQLNYYEKEIVKYGGILIPVNKN